MQKVKAKCRSGIDGHTGASLITLGLFLSLHSNIVTLLTVHRGVLALDELIALGLGSLLALLSRGGTLLLSWRSGRLLLLRRLDALVVIVAIRFFLSALAGGGGSGFLWGLGRLRRSCGEKQVILATP